MFRLTPALKDYIWGGYKLKDMFGRDNGGKKISESWEVSVHPDGPSLCPDGKTLAILVPPHRHHGMIHGYMEKMERCGLRPRMNLDCSSALASKKRG